MYELINMLAEDSDLIPYRKSLRKLTGSVTSAILLQQVVHRFKVNGYQPFYKFKSECTHSMYTPGDSWLEELQYGPKEFVNALGKIATKATKKEMETNGKSSLMDGQTVDKVVIFWTDQSRLTWYWVNMGLLAKLLKGIFLSDERAFTKLPKGNLPFTENPKDVPENNYDDSQKRDLGNLKPSSKIIINPPKPNSENPKPAKAKEHNSDYIGQNLFKITIPRLNQAGEIWASLMSDPPTITRDELEYRFMIWPEESTRHPRKMSDGFRHISYPALNFKPQPLPDSPPATNSPQTVDGGNDDDLVSIIVIDGKHQGTYYKVRLSPLDPEGFLTATLQDNRQIFIHDGQFEITEHAPTLYPQPPTPPDSTPAPQEGKLKRLVDRKEGIYQVESAEADTSEIKADQAQVIIDWQINKVKKLITHYEQLPGHSQKEPKRQPKNDNRNWRMIFRQMLMHVDWDMELCKRGITNAVKYCLASDNDCMLAGPWSIVNVAFPKAIQDIKKPPQTKKKGYKSNGKHKESGPTGHDLSAKPSFNPYTNEHEPARSS